MTVCTVRYVAIYANYIDRVYWFALVADIIRHISLDESMQKSLNFNKQTWSM